MSEKSSCGLSHGRQQLFEATIRPLSVMSCRWRCSMDHEMQTFYARWTDNQRTKNRPPEITALRRKGQQCESAYSRKSKIVNLRLQKSASCRRAHSVRHYRIICKGQPAQERTTTATVAKSSRTRERPASDYAQDSGAAGGKWIFKRTDGRTHLLPVRLNSMTRIPRCVVRSRLSALGNSTSLPCRRSSPRYNVWQWTQDRTATKAVSRMRCALHNISRLKYHLK